jgi:hypothetical protein
VSDDGNWFAPKRYGYGPGVPISWQGWTMTIVFVALVLVLCMAMKSRPMQLAAALVPPTVIFVVISCRTTRGGCHWRWGGDE